MNLTTRRHTRPTRSSQRSQRQQHSALQQYIAEGSSYFNALNDEETLEEEPG